MNDKSRACLMVPYVHIVSLAARGLAETSPAFDDPMARDLWASLGVRALDVVPDPAEREVALAITIAVDDITRRWIDDNAGQPVIELGACLSTRFARVHPRTAPFITVDEPSVAELRCELFGAGTEDLVQIGAPLEKREWLSRAIATRRPVLVVLERLLDTLHCQDAMQVLDNLAVCLPKGSVLLLATGPVVRAELLSSKPGAALRLRHRATRVEVSYPFCRVISATKIDQTTLICARIV